MIDLRGSVLRSPGRVAKCCPTAEVGWGRWFGPSRSPTSILFGGRLLTRASSVGLWDLRVTLESVHQVDDELTIGGRQVEDVRPSTPADPCLVAHLRASLASSAPGGHIRAAAVGDGVDGVRLSFELGQALEA
jgi:hypothetical protein